MRERATSAFDFVALRVFISWAQAARSSGMGTKAVYRRRFAWDRKMKSFAQSLSVMIFGVIHSRDCSSFFGAPADCYRLRGSDERAA